MECDVRHAIVVGGHVNAQTIVRSLKRISFGGTIALLTATDESLGLAAFCNPDVEVWRVPLTEPGDLLHALAGRFGRRGERTAVFFTDERFHLALSESQLERIPWLVAHIGAPRHVRTVLDRQLFCRFVSERQLADVPRTIDGRQNPFETFGKQFILRPRFSWHDLSRHEPVRLVSSRKAFEAWVRDFGSRGLGADDLCYQEVVSSRTEDNVSVCGWYDADMRHLVCTRKVLQHPAKTGNGDVVERIEPPAGVMEAATRILCALDYDGPFELEFVFDPTSATYRVIELNPRFWMQHGLVEALTGHALTAAYLTRPALTPSKAESESRYWVNPMYALFRLLKCDFRGIRYARHSRAYLPFTFRQAAGYCPMHALRRMSWGVRHVIPHE